jgi:uncharacterized protein YihD (DUF1040 family)
MRKKERIQPIITRLWNVWNEHPHLRLAQLIGNVFRDDPYHVEDEEFITKIEQYYGKE